MEKKFENLTEITDRQTFDDVREYFEELIQYATRNGYLKEMGADNEYTREMGRVGIMLADYESIYMDLSPLKFKKPSPVPQVQSPQHQRGSSPRVRRQRLI